MPINTSELKGAQQQRRKNLLRSSRGLMEIYRWIKMETPMLCEKREWVAPGYTSSENPSCLMRLSR